MEGVVVTSGEGFSSDGSVTNIIHIDEEGKAVKKKKKDAMSWKYERAKCILVGRWIIQIDRLVWFK